jgi:hypothetical protein
VLQLVFRLVLRFRAICHRSLGDEARTAGPRQSRKREFEAAIEDLTQALGHNPDGAERILIETAAAQLIESRKLRARGRSSLEADRLVLRCFRSLGLNGERVHRAPGRTPISMSMRDRLLAEEDNG